MGFKHANLEFIHKEGNIKGRNGGLYEGTQLVGVLCKKKCSEKKKKKEERLGAFGPFWVFFLA
jgi:hypothetical protein